MRGAVLIGILAVTIVSIAMGFTPFGGVMSMPPSLAPTFLQLDIKGALDIGLVSVIFAFLFVDLFDNSGTLIGVAKRAGLMGKDGHMPKMGRALIADSTAAMAGSLLGTSTTTSYIESAAGVSAGGRTGLTAVVVAILFLLALFFSPLAASVPAFATAPALLFVAVLMTSGLAEIDWDDITVAAPVVVTALAMPFTYSIANGIAFGFISWTAIKLLSGRGRELNSGAGDSVDSVRDQVGLVQRMTFDSQAYAVQLEEKVTRLRDLLAPFGAPEPAVFDSPLKNFRLRAEFRLWREAGERHYAMFSQEDKRTPILIEEFPIASLRINELMPQLKAAWQASAALSHKLFQVEFLTTLAGDAMITLCYHRPLDEHWHAAASKLAADLNVSVIGRSKGKREVIGHDYVVEQMDVGGRTFSYRQPEGAFTQPNGTVNQKMLNWAYDSLGDRSDDLLELYCGNGNFTLPLATRVRKVLATEISKASVNAALSNLSENAVDNVTLVRLSAEELTEALNEVRPFRRLHGIDLKSYEFGSVFVDPPRAGMDPDTCELTRRFDNILYISCNPETLAANIAQLHDTHRITRCAMFDQFPWTHHMESGVLLTRR